MILRTSNILILVKLDFTDSFDVLTAYGKHITFSQGMVNERRQEISLRGHEIFALSERGPSHCCPASMSALFRPFPYVTIVTSLTFPHVHGAAPLLALHGLALRASGDHRMSTNMPLRSHTCLHYIYSGIIASGAHT